MLSMTHSLQANTSVSMGRLTQTADSVCGEAATQGSSSPLGSLCQHSEAEGRTRDCIPANLDGAEVRLT